MTRYTNSAEVGDIFVTKVLGPVVSEEDAIRLNESSDIAVHGGNLGETLPVRIVHGTRHKDINLIAVPANERSITANEDYVRITVQCLRSGCDETIYLPEEYKNNDIFCSIECAGQVRCDDAPTIEEQQPINSLTITFGSGPNKLHLSETRSATVSRISNSRNRLVRIDDKEVNIGPVNCRKGDEVIVQRVTDRFAICLNERYRHTNYRIKLNNMIPERELPKPLPSLSSPEQKGETTDRRTETESTDSTSADSEEATNASESKTKSEKAESSPPEPRHDSRFETPEIDSQESDNIGSESFNDSGEDELSELRAQAMAAATDDPQRDFSVSHKSEYQRSEVIRRYAKARAKEHCELCGDPAPFMSKKGEPYLEVHHVDELSTGGADHPDKVAALCPTCHMRIHYGKDGNELNEKLREQLPN